MAQRERERERERERPVGVETEQEERAEQREHGGNYENIDAKEKKMAKEMNMVYLLRKLEISSIHATPASLPFPEGMV